MEKIGIDISYYQGNIDFKKVKLSGIDFAILRIGYGMYDNQKDKKFEDYYQGCKNNDIEVGVYLYSYALSVEDAEKEANLVLKWLNGRNLQLPVYFDIEDKSQAKLQKSVLNKICETFCNTIEKGGYWAGIYSNKNWADNIISGKELGKRYTYWIAQYNDKCTYTGPYAMWQCSSKGRVNGINGYVDKDILYQNLGGKLKSNDIYYPKYNGISNSLVDALKSLNIDSSFSNRKKIANKNGINIYLGTAKQNILLFNLLKLGKLKK